jgi:ribosomal protein L11 methylase PrmA
VGTDTDPLAVKAAARNAELNGCAASFVSLRCSPHLSDPEPMQEVSRGVTVYLCWALEVHQALDVCAGCGR